LELLVFFDKIAARKHKIGPGACVFIKTRSQTMRENHGDTAFTAFLSGLYLWHSFLGSENLQNAGAPSEFKQNWRLKSATGVEIHESHFNFSEWTVTV